MTHEAESPVALAIAQVAAGQAPDWVALTALADTAADRALLAELEMVQRLAAAVPGWEGAPPSDTIGIPAPDLDPGEAWGSLQVIETIARGAHGAVFRAWDTRLARMVALKLVRYDDASAADALREARLIAQLNHPGIIAIHGADRQGATVGWWMPLIDGQTLEDLVIGLGPQSDTEATAIGIAVGGALGAVHAAGLIHNDVKLHNIMRERGGRIVLMDFSAGRRAAAGADEAAASGTPLYMAPELFRGATPSVQTDIYSLGVVLFRLVTGQYPVVGNTVAELREAHRLQQRQELLDVRPDVSHAFARVVDCALAPEASARFRSAGALVQALSAAAPRPARRRWPLVAALAAAVAVGGAGGAWSVGGLRKSAAPAPTVPTATPAAAPLPEATRRVWRGYEDLAAMQAEQGDYRAAFGSYEQARAVLFAALGTNSLLVGLGEAKMGWMLARAGQHDAAWPQLQTGLHKLQQRGGRDHPYRATVFAAYAASLQQAGRHAEALVALREALAIRQHFLGIGQVTAADVASAIGVTDDALARAIAQGAIDRDQDGDGLPDAAEAALGLDPGRVRSRGDAIDGDGDHDGDGWPDRLEVGWDWDPSRVVAHYGAVDPLDAGFRAVRPFSASAATDADTLRPTWNLVTGDLGHYSWDLLESFKRAAAAGFTLTSRSRLRAGGGYVGVDLLPAGPRFDIDSYFNDAGEVYIKNNTNIVPHAGPEHVVGRHAMPLVRLEFSQASGATVWIDGRRRGDRYRGMTSYQAGEGLFFGAYNVFSRVPNGMADYALVHVVVPPPPGRR